MIPSKRRPQRAPGLFEPHRAAERPSNLRSRGGDAAADADNDADTDSPPPIDPYVLDGQGEQSTIDPYVLDRDRDEDRE